MPVHPEVAAAQARADALQAEHDRAHAVAAADPRLPLVAEIVYEAERARATALTPSPTRPNWTALDAGARAPYERAAVRCLLGYTAAGHHAAEGLDPEELRRPVKRLAEPGALNDGHAQTGHGRLRTLHVEVGRCALEAAKVLSLSTARSMALGALADPAELLALAKRPHAEGPQPSPDLGDEPGFPVNVARSVVHALRGDLVDVGHDPGPRAHMQLHAQAPRMGARSSG